MMRNILFTGLLDIYPRPGEWILASCAVCRLFWKRLPEDEQIVLRLLEQLADDQQPERGKLHDEIMKRFLYMRQRESSAHSIGWSVIGRAVAGCVTRNWYNDTEQCLLRFNMALEAYGNAMYDKGEQTNEFPFCGDLMKQVINTIMPSEDGSITPLPAGIKWSCTLREIAADMHKQCDYSIMPIFADALEDFVYAQGWGSPLRQFFYRELSPPAWSGSKDKIMWNGPASILQTLMPAKGNWLVDLVLGLRDRCLSQ